MAIYKRMKIGPRAYIGLGPKTFDKSQGIGENIAGGYMNKVLTIMFAALAALTMGLKAQDASFGDLYKSLPQPDASAVAVPAPIPVDVAPVAKPSAAPREWLVMVFINGVNDLGILGFASKSVNDMEQVGSTDKMAVVVEYDMLGQDGSADRNLQFQRGAKTLYITKDNDTNKITSVPFYTSADADMGSAANLVRFAKRGIRRFPAKKVALVVWNHGAGRQGISFDDLSGNHMEVDQLGQALAQIQGALGHKIDVFATDACLMQMASVAYQFRNSANVVVGSEEVVPGDSYPYAQILGPLAGSPGMGAEQLGALMVSAYGAHYPGDATLSALRTSALPGFVQALNAWIAAVRADKAALSGAYSKSLAAVTSHFTYEDSKDLVDYINKVDSNPKAGAPVKAAGAALKTYIARDLLIRNVAKPAGDDPYTAANGLAIYIPDLRYDSGNYEKMDFAADSEWADFIKGMMEARLKP
jgi:hypothetical protein